MTTVPTPTDAAALLRSTDDIYVRYDAEPESNGNVRIRRTASKKARRSMDRTLLAVTDIAVLSQDEALWLMGELASSLRYSEPQP